MSTRDGKLIGHSYYGDDADFDLTPIDSMHLRDPGGNTMEFVAGTDGQQRWIMRGEDGSVREVLQLAAMPLPASEMHAYAGDYRSSEISASYDIVLSGSGLAVQPPGSSEVQIKPIGKDAFGAPGMGMLHFRSAHGEVAGFALNRYNLRGLRFDRFRRVD